MKAKYGVADRVYSLDHDKFIRMQVQAVIDDPHVVAEVTYICEWPERDRENEEDNYFLESQLVPNSDDWVKAKLQDYLERVWDIQDRLDSEAKLAERTWQMDFGRQLQKLSNELAATANELKEFIDYAY